MIKTEVTNNQGLLALHKDMLDLLKSAEHNWTKKNLNLKREHFNFYDYYSSLYLHFNFKKKKIKFSVSPKLLSVKVEDYLFSENLYIEIKGMESKSSFLDFNSVYNKVIKWINQDLKDCLETDSEWLRIRNGVPVTYLSIQNLLTLYLKEDKKIGETESLVLTQMYIKTKNFDLPEYKKVFEKEINRLYPGYSEMVESYGRGIKKPNNIISRMSKNKAIRLLKTFDLYNKENLEKINY